MLFNSFNFLCIFLPIVFIVYYLPIFRRFQIFVLIIAGFVFYSYIHMEYLVLLIASAFTNAVFSYGVLQAGSPLSRKLYALIGVSINLFLLSFFKYGALFYKTFFETSNLGEWLVSLPLPIGISFYTFQGISLLVDAMKNEIPEQPKSLFQHIVHTVFFISFFPHSIAGPIVKAHDFLPQISPKRWEDIPITSIFKTLILGFFLKTVIADNIQNHTFWIAYPYFDSIGSLQLFAMMIGYSAQIFADFAGYSLIAIGIAALFGYRLPQNFNFPYIAQSFREFWQRWHMSLSSWLRDYLYIPLGGNRKGTLRTYINLFLVMLLGGMWHGAAWNYLAWGAAHGVFLALERGCRRERRELDSPPWTYFRIILVFLLVSWAWLFFKLPHAEYVFSYTKCFFANFSMSGKMIGNIDNIFWCLFYSLPVFLYHAAYFFNIPNRFSRWHECEPFIYAVMLFLILANGGTSDAFIYFQF